MTFWEKLKQSGCQNLVLTIKVVKKVVGKAINNFTLADKVLLNDGILKIFKIRKVIQMHFGEKITSCRNGTKIVM